MAAEEKMTVDERRKYLSTMKKRYVKASRKKRGQLLDEMEAVTEMHRKSLVRLMNGSLERKASCTQRGSTYGPQVDDALRVIADSLDNICAERLTPNLVWVAEQLARHGEMEVTEALLKQLGQISISTVGRRLRRTRQDRPRLPRRHSPCTRKVTQEIPMKRIPWDEQEPGHFEVDLVHHCGPIAEGEYVHTLQMIDIATGWSERRAVLGRSYLVTEDAFHHVVARLPFAVREIHPDNGSEFLNHHLIRFWKEAVKGVQLSRSRPYQKNDNRFVEQKNATLVRAFLGDDRLDTVAQTLAVNGLYDKMWLYYNLFQPVMRLKEKIVVLNPDGQSTRMKRRFDDARTPFDRLCTTNAISQEHKAHLTALREQNNPRQLRHEIYALLDYIFSLPGAVPGHTEDVHQTLSVCSHSETLLPQFTLSDLHPAYVA